MVYLIHDKDERGRLFHWIVFVQGSLANPKEVFALPFTPELLEQLDRLGIAYQKVSLSKDGAADNCPICGTKDENIFSF